MVHSSPRLPPLDTLEAFADAARTGSFSAAAEKLGLTHGAVSRQVSRLERWLGVRLFERAARGVTMTPEGRRFFARAEDALAILSGSGERWSPRRGTTVVRLSVTPALTSLWLFPRLHAIEGEDLHLDLTLEHRLADFAEGIDLAIRCGGGPWAGIRSVQLWRERAMPLAAPALAEALGGEAGPGMLLEHPILHDSNVEGWRLWFAEAGIDYAPRTRDRRFEDYNLVLDACVQGLGLCLARPPLCDDAIARGLVRPVADRSIAYPVAYHLIRPAEPLRGAAAEIATRLMRAAGLDETDIAAFVAPGRARADRRSPRHET